MNWRKSSFSGGGGNECVELACTDTSRLVRDSKNPTGPRLNTSLPSMAAFLVAVKNDSL
ncbi:DUF397 domain-containing protein [Lentzea sp. NBRC 102530]|uniref:DUF397 domain-containing protein n=1 Tax=Lentzea sp. NBRC 102530 TaxID=3032201 RepID=UPI0024A03DEE|nr:DUF397 domain-containing protein [Lentzea sp. NBRC 102530]GLY55308.1 hypothetical protein Lesp01_89630 [Lentzea sp. NBRC 102530]